MRRTWMWIGVLSAVLCVNGYAGVSAAEPIYLTVRGIQPPTHAHEPSAVRVIPRYRTPYAYGWFGVQPRRHTAIHYGYRQNYTEWSVR